MLIFKRIFLIGLLVLIGLAALACIGAIVISGMRGRMVEATLATGFLWGVLFALSLAAFAAIEQRRQIILASLGLLLCGLLVLTTPVVVVIENYRYTWRISSTEVMIKLTVVSFLFTALLCIGALTLAPKFKYPYKLVPWFAVLSSCFAVGVTTLYLILERSLRYSSSLGFESLMMSGMVASITGIFATYILNKFLATTVLDPVSLPSHKLPITCPRCMKAQDLPMGESRCVQCKLKFKVDIEEPKCPTCGYVLHMLTRPICPECGTKFGEEELAGSGAEGRSPAL